MANGTCRVPNCESPANTRGLCAKHWYRAFKGQPGPLQDEALQYALPSKKGGGGKAADGGVEHLKKNVAAVRRKNCKPDAETDPLADAAIAAVTAFATVMGIRRVEHAQGFLFVGDDDTTIILTNEGELREATLTIGDVVRQNG